MLTNVLLRHGLIGAFVAILVTALITGLALGGEHVPAVAAGGVLLALDGAGLVYLVGRLLDPDVASLKKWVFAFLLVAKLVVVAGLLWLSLQQLSGVGVLIGIGAGLVGLVAGLNRGSTSRAGQEAMAAAEARIREETGDNRPESG